LNLEFPNDKKTLSSGNARSTPFAGRAFPYSSIRHSFVNSDFVIRHFPDLPVPENYPGIEAGAASERRRVEPGHPTLPAFL
jgi:hypothetical protein